MPESAKFPEISSVRFIKYYQQGTLILSAGYSNTISIVFQYLADSIFFHSFSVSLITLKNYLSGLKVYPISNTTKTKSTYLCGHESNCRR